MNEHFLNPLSHQKYYTGSLTSTAHVKFQFVLHLKDQDVDRERYWDQFFKGRFPAWLTMEGLFKNIQEAGEARLRLLSGDVDSIQLRN
jgi:hypothetical protein